MQKDHIKNAWRGAEKCKECGIRHMVLFADMQQDDFDRIHLPIDEISYQSGDYIYRQGDTPDFVFTVRSGLVKLEQTSENGDQRIIRLLRQGDLAGMEMLESEHPLTMDQDAIALDEVQVCRIPKSVITTLRRDTPHLHKALMQRWQKALSCANIWITELSTGNARQRVARLLLLLAKYTGSDTTFIPSRKDMGAILGITTESASKVTAEFRRNGWLEPFPGHHAKLNLEKIRQQAD